MKLTLAVLTLALFGSLSVSAQEVPTVPTVDMGQCWMFQPELFLYLAPSQSQCERNSLIYNEFQNQLDELYNEVNVLYEKSNSLLRSGQIPKDRFVAIRQIGEIQNKIWDLEEKIKGIVAERTRKIRGVLDQKQRAMLDQLQALTPVVKVYGQASGFVIDGYQTMYPQPSVWMQKIQRPRQ